MTRFALFAALLGAIVMLVSASPALAESTAKVDGDFTIEWRQMLATADAPTQVMIVGEMEVAIRPLPKPKARPKDPTRAALFVGEARSATVIHPGKWYHFALVGGGGQTELFINGFPDKPSKYKASAPAAAGDQKPDDRKPITGQKLAGAVTTMLPDVTVTPKSSSAEEILARVKSALPQRAITTVAHRGVHEYAPENTRISYVQAVDAKTPVIEIDTALTKDGHIVLMHDKTVDRTTDGEGAVADLTLEQIRKLDAGSWKDARYKGEPVPTIDEITDVARGKATIMFDLKAEGQGKAIATWLEKSKFPHDQVIVAPWTDEEGVALRKHIPADVPMIRLTSPVPTKTGEDAYFSKMKQAGFSGFSVNWVNLTEAFVRAAQKHGMKVYVWTVNDSPDIAGAALLGVDGVVTDDPANTMKLLSQLLPPPTQ